MQLDGVDVVGVPQPGRIRAARDLRALTQSEVVERMSRPVSTGALSQIEAGRIRPSLDTLHDLADALDVPTDFFYSAWADNSSDDVLSRVTYFRDLAATPARERRRAAAMALLVSDLVSVLDQYVRLPKRAVPDYTISPSAHSDEIEEAASALRGEWDLGDGPIPHVVRQIERQGVFVARLSLGNKSVDAFSIRLLSRSFIFLTDDKSNYVRSRFDAGHELGHLVLHRNSDSADRRIERQAHNFAAAFLLPIEVAREELPRRVDRSGWSKLAEMKRTWGISLSALLFRARDVGVLEIDSYRSAMKYLSARGWRTTEPGDRELGLPEAPALFEHAFRTIELEYGKSAEDVIRSAHLPVADVVRLIHAASDRRPGLAL